MSQCHRDLQLHVLLRQCAIRPPTGRRRNSYISAGTLGPTGASLIGTCSELGYDRIGEVEEPVSEHPTIATIPTSKF